MHQYFKQVIEPQNKNLRDLLRITTIVVKYEPSEEQVNVLTSGEVYARSAANDAHMEELHI